MAKKVYNDPIYKKNRLIVLEGSAWTCHYCKGPANTADHILPVSQGGTNEVSNLLPSCRPCNSSKKDKTRVRLKYWNRKY